MFKHVNTGEEDCETVEDSDNDDDDDISVEGINLDKIKPVLEKFKQAVENFEEMLGKYSLKCKSCEFEAKDLNGLSMHMKAKHNK